ncbi:MAG: universal stress protein [Ardenticatenaceae bacterium]|nr:universal stress protein [Ardenticatenaceae bacterium]
MFRSILVPLDGSPLAEQVLPLALSIAKRAGARLTLLQVVPVPGAALTLTDAVLSADAQLDLLQSQTDKYLRDIAQRLLPASSAEPDPIPVEREMITGQAGLAISECAATLPADLIVMATHGRSGLHWLALGSVTGQVLQLSPAPLIIVRPRRVGPVRFDELPALDRIMVTLDGSELAERVLPVAARLGQLFHSELFLFRAAHIPTVSAIASELQPVLRARAEIAAWEYLRTVAASFNLHRFEVRTVTEPGTAVEAILAVAEELDVTLIAMTTHGRTGLSRVVSGSVADRIVRSSARPVLIVRSPLEQAPIIRA